MSHVTFDWNVAFALNAIAISLWIGSLFYHVFGLQSSLGLLDQTQKTSVLLQSLKKLFHFNWGNAFIALICQSILFVHQYLNSAINWLSYLTLSIIILMILLQFYGFTTSYRKARRALRPKNSVFNQINKTLKLNILLGILNIILLNV